jgi:predicted RNA methylase
MRRGRSQRLALARSDLTLSKARKVQAESPQGLKHVQRARLQFDAKSNGRLTHYLFRYPAKFHPPVVRRLLTDYTNEGDRVLDPFCGSGTLLVEAAIAGRHATGTDVDPLAVFVSAVKSKPLQERRLETSFARLLHGIEALRRSAAEYDERQWTDLSDRQFAREASGLSLPAIPNLEHWFRRYVAIDLARLRNAIQSAALPAAQQRFFMLAFAAIIRAASNADPVPVSGLEVTSHMVKRDRRGRIINPFALWEVATKRAIRDMAAFRERASRDVRIRTRQADVTELSRRLRGPTDAVITSPPYHGAVDYYRRHQLEMYWLGLTTSHDERLRLLQRYIGRTKVAARHPLLQTSYDLPANENQVEARMRTASPVRADAFRHYCLAMARAFAELGSLLRRGTPALFVVGHSTWKDAPLNTSDLFAELAHPLFELSQVLDYPVKNRYMSYARRNGASIDKEFVLVMRRTDAFPRSRGRR